MPIQAGSSRRTSNNSSDGSLGAALPGFAKASLLAQKRPRETDKEEMDERTLADSLFSATADQALEDAAEPSVPRKKTPFLIEEEDDSMEIDAMQQDEGDSSMLLDGEDQVGQEDEATEDPKESGWQPKRRPSRIAPTQETGQPANMQSSPEAAPRPLFQPDTESRTLAPKGLSYRRSNGIPESDDEELPSLPRAPSPKKSMPFRTNPSNGKLRNTGMGTQLSSYKQSSAS